MTSAALSSTAHTFSLVLGRFTTRFPASTSTSVHCDLHHYVPVDLADDGWSPDEIDAISALFSRPTVSRRRKPLYPRPAPLPRRMTTRVSPGQSMPNPKHHVRLAARPTVASSRAPFSDRVRKDPSTLISLAHQIAALPPTRRVSSVLGPHRRFLRKGSLSLTIRELGHLGLPIRALETLLWAQDCSSGSASQSSASLFPDDRVLASAVEVLARFGQLRMENELDIYLRSANRQVLESMVKGFIKAGNLGLARKILLLAKDNKRTLDASIHAKLILAAGKTPDGYRLAEVLVDELGEREDFHLTPQDCNSVMKVCIKLQRYDALESLFGWYKEFGGGDPTVVMYTTVMYGRHCAGRSREALALVWEMEEKANIIQHLDLPAYRVILSVCATLNDVGRAARYFSRMKEAGLAPTRDIYAGMIKAYAASGSTAKCWQLLKEAQMRGWVLQLPEDKR